MAIREVSKMFESIEDFFAKERGLTVYYYPEIDQVPICKVYKPGELIFPPESISKEGYVIEGWYRSKRYTNKKLIDLKRLLFGKISLYAKWKRVDEK